MLCVCVCVCVSAYFCRPSLIVVHTSVALHTHTHTLSLTYFAGRGMGRDGQRISGPNRSQPSVRGAELVFPLFGSLQASCRRPFSFVDAHSDSVSQTAAVFSSAGELVLGSWRARHSLRFLPPRTCSNSSDFNGQRNMKGGVKAATNIQ